jgi:hypothetical protein
VAIQENFKQKTGGKLLGGKNRKARNKFGLLNMADSEGFEPPVGLTLRLISSQVH